MVSSIVEHELIEDNFVNNKNNMNTNSYNPEVPKSVPTPPIDKGEMSIISGININSNDVSNVSKTAILSATNKINNNNSNNSHSMHNNNGNVGNHATNHNQKLGSRRIFTPQFKLQVLESYRNDDGCKGNQRATARKYNIHRRQIQKWLQCESNLRSSVANIHAQGSVKHQFHNISHHHQQHSAEQQQKKQLTQQPVQMQIPLVTMPAIASKSNFFAHHHMQQFSHQRQAPLEQHQQISLDNNCNRQNTVILNSKMLLSNPSDMNIPATESINASVTAATVQEVLNPVSLAAVVAACATGAVTVPGHVPVINATTTRIASPNNVSPLRPTAIGGSSAKIITPAMLHSHHYHYAMPPYTHTPATNSVALPVPVPVPVSVLSRHIPPQHLHHHYNYYNQALASPTHAHVYAHTLPQTHPSSIYIPTESLSVNVVSATTTTTTTTKTTTTTTATAMTKENATTCTKSTSTATNTLTNMSSTSTAIMTTTIMTPSPNTIPTTIADDERRLNQEYDDSRDELRESLPVPLPLMSMAETKTKTVSVNAILAGNNYVNMASYNIYKHNLENGDSHNNNDDDVKYEEFMQRINPANTHIAMPIDLSVGTRSKNNFDLQFGLLNYHSSVLEDNICKTEFLKRFTLEDVHNTEGIIVDLTSRKRKIFPVTHVDITETPEKLLKCVGLVNNADDQTQSENVKGSKIINKIMCESENDVNVDIEEDEEINVTVSDKSIAAKPIKLFKPYLLDSDDGKSEKLENFGSMECHCSKHREPIVWSNHLGCLSPQSYDSRQDSSRGSNFQCPSDEKYTFPAGSPISSNHNQQLCSTQSALSPTSAPALSPTSFLYPKGSPVSGYESSSSTYSEPISRSDGENFPIISDRSYRVEFQMHTVFENNPMAAQNKSDVQLWLDHDVNPTANPPAAETTITIYG